jgi:glycosyltransferase involved in cell wall biosynthesis
MIYDLEVTGHHAYYIRHLLRYWNRNKLPGQLYILVSPSFMEQHSDVVAMAETADSNCAQFTPISHEEFVQLKSQRFGIKRMLDEWRILNQYAVKLGISHCLIMYFDPFQLPLAFGLKASCSLSGIYFKPAFHYKSLGFDQPSLRETVRWQIKEWLFRKALQQPSLRSVFCLDPFAVTYLKRRIISRVDIVPLADPIPLAEIGSALQVANLREALAVEADRRIFLLFGSLSLLERKGVFQLLEAATLLPLEVAKQICLLIVGRLEGEKRDLVEARVTAVRSAHPVQIILVNEFVQEEEIQTYFHLSDVVVAPYQRHIGMSGVLIRSAAAQKPILAPDFGLLGKVVHQYKLGLPVDSTKPQEIAKALCAFIEQPPESFIDFQRAQTFVHENSPDEFARVLFQYLLPSA